MKLTTPVQGIIVLALAIVIGVPLFLTVRSNDEGFLGLASFDSTSTAPQSTPEPTEEPVEDPTTTQEPSADATDAAPISTEEPIVDDGNVAPASTDEPISDGEDEAATAEPTDEAPNPADTTTTQEPTESDTTSSLPSGEPNALIAMSDGNMASPQEDGDVEPETVTTSFPAPLGADANVLFQWFAFLGLLFGASFAVRKDFTSHRNIMTFLVLLNWFSITGRMTANFSDYSGDIPDPTFSQEAIYFHAALGLLTALYASYLVIRMWFEDYLPDAVKVKNIKLWMRITITSWLFLILLGTYMYFDIYSN